MFIEFSRPLVVTVVSAMIAIVDSRVGGGGVRGYSGLGSQCL